jgi:hypothetical protein
MGLRADDTGVNDGDAGRPRWPGEGGSYHLQLRQDPRYAVEAFS